MDKRALLLLATLLATGAAFAEAYRWVDDEGVVHYSDRPQPGTDAEQVVLPEANTTTVRRYSRPTQGNEGTEEQPQAVRYESIAITAPAAEETLWNIGAVLNVNVAVQPGIQPGHQLRVYFDGNPTMVTSTSFQLEEVHRGVHNLQAEVLDETGKLMIRSQPIRFYVQQNTVNF